MMFLLLFILYAIALSAGQARAGHRSRDLPSGGAHRQPPDTGLFVGATDTTGRQLVLQALERGYAVTAFVRHTFASYMMMNGAELLTVSRILGHKTINMTMRYAHLSLSYQREAMNKLRILNGPKA